MDTPKESVDPVDIARKLCHSAETWMDRAILSTPTGERREKLTEANIHLLTAAKLLKEL